MGNDLRLTDKQLDDYEEELTRYIAIGKPVYALNNLQAVRYLRATIRQLRADLKRAEENFKGEVCENDQRLAEKNRAWSRVIKLEKQLKALYAAGIAARRHLLVATDDLPSIRAFDAALEAAGKLLKGETKRYDQHSDGTITEFDPSQPQTTNPDYRNEKPNEIRRSLK